MRTPWYRHRTRLPRYPFRNLIARFQDRIAKSPNDPSLRHALAKCLGQAGRYREAIDETQRLLAIDPKYPAARRMLVGLKVHQFVSSNLWRR